MPVVVAAAEDVEEEEEARVKPASVNTIAIAAPAGTKTF